MENILKILSHRIQIISITIENFTVLDSELMVHIMLFSEDYGKKTITFRNVKNIHIDSQYYVCSTKLFIFIEDISVAQWEGISYQIAISEDIMTFYCMDIEINSSFSTLQTSL